MNYIKLDLNKSTDIIVKRNVTESILIFFWRINLVSSRRLVVNNDKMNSRLRFITQNKKIYIRDLKKCINDKF